MSESHSHSHSVTDLIEQLKAGEQGRPQQELLNRYFLRLVALARQKLGDVSRRAEDEEDVAIDALNSFFDGISRSNFPQLKDRTNLWPLLAKITVRKAINQRHRVRAQKRGGGFVRGDSAFVANDSSGADYGGIERVADEEPTPESVEMLNEECRRLLAMLPDESLRIVAQRKLEGYSNTEIGEELNVVERTIERKVGRIREIWSQEIDGE